MRKCAVYDGLMTFTQTLTCSWLCYM